jgi:hypothetical protein
LEKLENASNIAITLVEVLQEDQQNQENHPKDVQLVSTLKEEDVSETKNNLKKNNLLLLQIQENQKENVQKV